MEPARNAFYTCGVIFDTLRTMLDRFDSGAYNPVEVLIELGLIGISINWCASVLHGTRGTRLLRGLLVLLVAATLGVRVVAQQLEWERLEFLYRFFITGLAFIALVAFQPELRRALIRAGEVSFLRRSSPERKVIAALVESAGYLSRNRYGALIGIQREVGLANWAENGTQLNAEVSADLLKTIFFPNSPLHDLGVILRESRIIAAGCQFPVTESGEVDASLGSRHRAGVGLSAESDALVLIVSEETGTISIADGGKLIRFLSLDDLEQELESRLSGRINKITQRSRGEIRSALWRFARRLLIVAPLSVIVWLMADQATLIENDDIPVQLTITHDANLDVQIRQPQPAVFSIDVRGPRAAVETLRSRSASRSLELTWALPAGYPSRPEPWRLDEADLRNLIESLTLTSVRGVRVENVDPGGLEFLVTDILNVPMPVRPNFGSTRVEQVQITPDTVDVQIRRTDLDRLSADERAVAVQLADAAAAAAQDGLIRIEAALLDLQIGRVRALRITPAAVGVTARVVSQRSQRKIDGVSVQILKSPQVEKHYVFEQTDPNEWLIDLVVEGDEAVVAGLQPSDVQAFVDFSDDPLASTAETRQVPVRLQLPDGVTLSGPPRYVSVSIRPREDAAP